MEIGIYTFAELGEGQSPAVRKALAEGRAPAAPSPATVR